jgi:uncharacterized protein (DUF927 family)
VFTSCILAFALHLRKKHGKTSVRVAAVHHKQTVQYSTIQYSTRTMNSTIYGRTTVIQISTVSQNNTDHRIHNRENTGLVKFNRNGVAGTGGKGGGGRMRGCGH